MVSHFLGLAAFTFIAGASAQDYLLPVRGSDGKIWFSVDAAGNTVSQGTIEAAGIKVAGVASVGVLKASEKLLIQEVDVFTTLESLRKTDEGASVKIEQNRADAQAATDKLEADLNSERAKSSLAVESECSIEGSARNSCYHYEVIGRQT